MTTAWDACIEAPFGRLGVRVRDGYVVRIEYLPPGGELVEPKGALAAETCRQLRAYLADPAFPFDLPIAPDGTPFRQRVWRELMRIPAGTAITYGELARRLGTSPRPIGGACGANPVPPVVPCHRVVAASGMGGFMGAVDGHPLAVKRWLLAHEGAHN